MRKFLLITVIIIGWTDMVYTQSYKLVQLTGMVMTDSDGDPKPLPFAEISILNTNRGVYSDGKGFSHLLFKMAIPLFLIMLDLNPPILLFLTAFIKNITQSFK